MKIQISTAYFDSLRGKIFKLLPLKENNDENLQKHIESLFRKLTGAYSAYEGIEDVAEYGDIVNMVGYMVNHDFSVDECRKDMFEMQNLLDKIVARLEGGDGFD